MRKIAIFLELNSNWSVRVVEGKEKHNSSLSRDELKKLFSLSDEEEFCQTKNLLDNPSDSSLSWNFHCNPLDLEDPVLVQAIDQIPAGAISFAMSKSVQPPSPLEG